jgi:uncharacterized protein YbjT (DUF2867 family)
VILVVGGTGRCGRHVCSRLLSAGERITILTRDPGQAVARRFQKRGARILQGDLLAPTLPARLLDGIDRIYYISSSIGGAYEEVASAAKVIDAARKHRVRHFVFQSVLFSRTVLAHCASKGLIERHLAASGIPSSVVSPGLFFECLDVDAELMRRHAASRTLRKRVFRFESPIPARSRLPWTQLSDIAATGVALLLEKGPGEKPVSVISRPLMTMAEIAKMLGDHFGIRVESHRVSLPNRDYARMLASRYPRRAPEAYMAKWPDRPYFAPLSEWRYPSRSFLESGSVTGTEPLAFREALRAYLKATVG